MSIKGIHGVEQMKRTGIDAPAQTEILSHLDRRKWKLAEINGVRCLTMMNGMMRRLSKRKWRGLLGRYILGVKNVGVGQLC